MRADAPTYTVEDLGTRDGFVATVTGINATGQVSGYISTDAGLRAVRFTDGPGWEYVPGLESIYSVATAINANGDMTGYYFAPAGLRAFRFAGGVLTTIDALPGGSFAVGFAIADNGDVVGYGTTTGGVTRAWRASGSVPVVPASLSAFSSIACGTNATGQVVGSMTTTAGYQHAFRLEADDTLTDLGSFTGAAGSSTACAIDADGRVGGRSDIADVSHAFLTASSGLLDVDAFGSPFSAIEALSSGVGVGTFTSATGEPHALVHTDADGTSDLNSRLAPGTGWTLQDATAVNASGRIAGQGVVDGNPRAFRLTPAATGDTTAPTITSVSASPSSITPPNQAMVSVTVSAVATDDHDPNPVCTVTAIDGHGAPAGDSSITGPLSGSVRATGGATYTFTVTCSDAAGNAATSGVNVVVPPDTTAPVFTSLTATPASIFPPKGQVVTVTTAAVATDDSGQAPVCSLASITGAGVQPGDVSVTGANTGTVKAIGGRTYSFHEVCRDAAGNAAMASTNVVVPPDTTAPVVTSLSATPGNIWGPNGKMVGIMLSVSATDNVDAAPQCSLTSVTSNGSGTGDTLITGQFTGSVRAERNADGSKRVYTFTVTCADDAGNQSVWATTVSVSKDAPRVNALAFRLIRLVEAKWGWREKLHGPAAASQGWRR